MRVSLKGVVFTVVVFLWAVDCSATIGEQRLKFVQAEEMIESGDDQGFFQLSLELADYPLHFYLRYQWLSKHLDQDQKIQQFLRDNQSSLYARMLHRQWLDALYKNKRWDAYMANYQASKSKQAQCRYQWARYQLNYKTKALTATKKIWLTGYSLPRDCDQLLAKFTQSSFLTQKLIWQRFRLAIDARQYDLASYLHNRMTSKIAKKDAKQWLSLLKNPHLIANADLLQNASKAQKADMFVYAVQRIIGFDVDKALHIWDVQKSRFKLTKEQLHKVDRSIALQLTFSKSDKAYAHFSRLKQSDKATRTWAVRAALIKNDWIAVQEALNKLSSEEKMSERWRYWQGKAFLQTNQLKKARELFIDLAKERSYYGFLAADYLQQDYLLADNPIKADEQEINALLAEKDFVIVNEFRALQRTKQAQQYWWQAIRGLKGTKLLVAAKIAEQWRWHKQAIMTVAQAKYWDDVSLRFPLDFTDEIQQNARLQGLDEAIIYGLVRRESMFDEAANSPAGALGLMQVMPKTGKQIAKEIKFPWRSSADLLGASVSVKFGAYYYKQMLDKFSGNFALAAAAYNAGPDSVNRWLNLDNVYAADLWIETIPYKETRAYVAAVLTYALIYQRQLGDKRSLMSDFMIDIQPRNVSESYERI
ncbi:MAG: transglycosylase SLT domain-containing protein [Methyloprofundus sp.]|nr:transglycosylase SLT domain-containing protein [Methyloprofundus sp.]MDT8427010.1 transglycosylase SLT domain-containing protein [Methyloprofundus sp.]